MLRSPQVIGYLNTSRITTNQNALRRHFSSLSSTGSRSLSSAVPKVIGADTAIDPGQKSTVAVKTTDRRPRFGRVAIKTVGVQPSTTGSILHTEAASLSVTHHAAESTAPSLLCYFGNQPIPITSELHIVTPVEDMPKGIWPAFRMMDENGKFCESTWSSLPPLEKEDLAGLRKTLVQHHPSFANGELSNNPLLQPSENNYPDLPTKNTLLRAHRQIIRLREMDGILQNAQRQGRISFYMTCRGEEAIHMGAAAALELGDTILAQYREAGLLMWRGFTLEQFTNQCFSNDLDLGKGRQMPVHYGSRALNYHTISSPLGTQLPQAVGAAYRLKLQKKPNVAICFFGEGAASTTDFHSACNFAATLHVPVIFFCRNNGFAISTPADEQYAGDGIVSRAPGYGMAGIRVDGNDIFAVSAAVKAAKDYALANSAPVLIEAMTYRQGHHSTSDDSTRYRNVKDAQQLADFGDPVKRLESFLTMIGWADADSVATALEEEKRAVMKAIEVAEKRPLPALKALFEDVYHQLPPHLKEQEKELHRHLAKYPGMYK